MRSLAGSRARSGRPVLAAPSRARRLVRYLLHGAVLAGLAAAAARYLRTDAFRLALREFHWAWLPLVLGFAFGSFALKGVRFCFLQRQLSSVPGKTVLKAYFGGQACSTLPGGIAARVGLLLQAGIPISRSGPA